MTRILGESLCQLYALFVWLPFTVTLLNRFDKEILKNSTEKLTLFTPHIDHSKLQQWIALQISFADSAKFKFISSKGRKLYIFEFVVFVLTFAIWDVLQNLLVAEVMPTAAYDASARQWRELQATFGNVQRHSLPESMRHFPALQKACQLESNKHFQFLKNWSL